MFWLSHVIAHDKLPLMIQPSFDWQTCQLRHMQVITTNFSGLQDFRDAVTC